MDSVSALGWPPSRQLSSAWRDTMPKITLVSSFGASHASSASPRQLPQLHTSWRASSFTCLARENRTAKPFSTNVNRTLKSATVGLASDASRLTAADFKVASKVVSKQIQVSHGHVSSYPVLWEVWK